MRRWLIGVAILLGLAAGPAHGETPLAVEDVLATVHAHPLAASARAGIDRADGEREAALGAFDVRARARSDWYPRSYYERLVLDSELRKLTSARGLSMFVGWRRGVGSFADYDLRSATLDRGELRAGLELPMLRDGAIDRARAELRKAEVSRQGARAEVDRRVLELERDATIAYWDWVAAGHRVAIRTRQLELARDRGRGLQQTIQAGDVAPIEEIDNARTIATREALVVAARREFLRAAQVVGLYLRDGAGRPVVPDEARLPELGALPPPLAIEADPASVLPQTTQPVLAVMDARLAANEVDRELADNQLLPSLNASMFAARGLGAADPQLPDRSELSFGVGLTFELPLERRQAKGARAIAQAERARLLAERRFVVEQLVVAARSATFELVAARQRADLAEEQDRLARRLAEAERQRFQQGDTTILIVNLREEAAAEAAIARVDAITEYFEARVRYATALGFSPRDRR